MPEAALPPLAEWESFYVIVGSSAAALTGLMFVVIALVVERRSGDQSEGVRAFGTPNILHFGAVLLVAAILTIPHHTVVTLRACVLACGVAGLALVAAVVVQARRQRTYDPEPSDWAWHAVLPALAYAALAVAAGLLGKSPEAALDVVAASVLSLLFIGIHNAWDSAVWMATRRSPEGKPDPSETAR